MKLMIMFPCNSTSLILGKMFKGDVIFYCPEEIHRSMAGTIPDELIVECFKLSKEISVVRNLDQLQEIDYLAFPFLDMLPYKERSFYAAICRNIFRYTIIFA